MFLANKLGPLPIWGWGVVAAGGGGIAYYKSKQPPKDGTNMPGGQAVGDSYSTMDSVNAASALIENDQNIGWGAMPDNLAFGPGVSYIDGSFFGDGPLSLWSAGAMDYSDTFQGWSGQRRGGRGRRGRRGLYGFGRSDRRTLGDDHPPGAGGYGRHRRKWDGQQVPSGGEGFGNGGDGFVAGAGGFGARGSMGWETGGGMPCPQQSTMGASGGQYHVQAGDTLSGIAARLWGNGADASGLLAANANVIGGQGVNATLDSGLVLTVPGAPNSGPPAPGGPAGNGIGGGSVGVNGYNSGAGPTNPASQGGNQSWPGQGTASAGASGGGSPTAGQSGSNSSRVRSGNASSNYATAGGKSGVQTTNKTKPTKSAPARNRPSGGRK